LGAKFIYFPQFLDHDVRIYRQTLEPKSWVERDMDHHAELLAETINKVAKGRKVKIVVPLMKYMHCIRFEVFTAVTMKNGVFWVATPCGSCKNRRFRGTWHLLHEGDKNR
jgi:hypothetical protein